MRVANGVPRYRRNRLVMRLFVSPGAVMEERKGSAVAVVLKNTIVIYHKPHVRTTFMEASVREMRKQLVRQTVRGWQLQLKCDKELSDLSNMFGPVLRGWSNHYGRFYPTAMKPLCRHLNDYLVRWMQRKYKRLARRVTRAARARGRIAERKPRSFVHWENGFIPAAR